VIRKDSSLRVDEWCSANQGLRRWCGCVRAFCVQAIHTRKFALRWKNSMATAHLWNSRIHFPMKPRLLSWAGPS
jgi:hypothetical protein